MWQMVANFVEIFTTYLIMGEVLKIYLTRVPCNTAPRWPYRWRNTAIGDAGDTETHLADNNWGIAV